ncbi:MAG: recombinase, partial [Erysipelotrichaceae bacterium]|nr:recombinase [Erysipelotrichaceae bacterium]
RIIDDDTFNAVEAERLKREKKLGRDNIPPKEKSVPVIFTDFYTKKSTQKFTDPIAQAEYAYGRIEGKVNE